MGTTGPRARYRGRSAEDRRAERRQRLLAAGLELYGTVGYAGASTERLCEAAGLSTRQFYEEFGNRNEVLVELYDQINREALQAVQEAIPQARARGAGLREVIRDAVRAYVETTVADVRRAQVAYVAVVGVSPQVEEHRFAQRRLWVTELCALAADAVRRQEIADRDYSLAMSAFVGAVNGLVHDVCMSRPRPTLEDVAETLAHMLYSSLTTMR